MKKIKLLRPFVYLGGVFFVGDVLKADEETAKTLVKNGTAEIVEDEALTPSPFPDGTGEDEE